MMRGEHGVDIGIGILHALDHGGLTHHAAAEEDLLTRVAALRVYERADVAEHALLGVLADGAGVEDHGVGALGRVGQAVARGLEHPAQLLGIGLVLLAAVGFDVGRRRDALRRPIIADLRAEPLLALDLLRRDSSGFAVQRAFLRILFDDYFYYCINFFVTFQERNPRMQKNLTKSAVRLLHKRKNSSIMKSEYGKGNDSA